jgi:serine/threonine protein kinase
MKKRMALRLLVDAVRVHFSSPSVDDDADQLLGLRTARRCGSFGQMYVASSDMATVAVKVISRHSYGDDERWSRLTGRELNIAQLVSPHKHICTTYDTFRTDDGNSCVIVMEYAPKGDPCDYVPAGGWGETEARRIFRQVVKAVRYMHRRGVLHLDIKPENVLISAKGDALLCDFGFSRFVDRGSDPMDDKGVGTLNYAPPEMLRGLSQRAGPSADVWSLGCLRLALITGEVPFNHGKNEDATARDIILARYRTPRGASPEVCDLLASMLRAPPHFRIRIDEILEHPWVAGPRPCP